MENVLYGVLLITPLMIGILFMLIGAFFKTLYSTRVLFGVIGILISIPFFALYWIQTQAYLAMGMVILVLIYNIKNFITDKNIERQITFAINEQTNKFDNYNISVTQHLPNVKDEPVRIKNTINLLSSKGLVSSAINISE